MQSLKDIILNGLSGVTKSMSYPNVSTVESSSNKSISLNGRGRVTMIPVATSSNSSMLSGVSLDGTEISNFNLGALSGGSHAYSTSVTLEFEQSFVASVRYCIVIIQMAD